MFLLFGLSSAPNVPYANPIVVNKKRVLAKADNVHTVISDKNRILTTANNR